MKGNFVYIVFSEKDSFIAAVFSTLEDAKRYATDPCVRSFNYTIEERIVL